MARRKTKSGVRFARVPSGSETCPFCIMLASRGFVYWSAGSAGENNHYHPHCDCVIVPGWEGMEVEGYNPSKLYDGYVEMLHDGTLDYSKLVKGGSESSHVLGWSPEQFKSVGDFQRFVEAAHTIEELQERCAIAEAEWAKSGLSDSYYSQLRQAVQQKKSELMVGVSDNVRSVGAMRNPVYTEWKERVSNTSANRIKQTQRDHVRGEKQYENNRKSRLEKYGREPSYFDMPLNEVEEIISSAVGTGTPQMTWDGKWSKTEICDIGHDVGVVFGNDGIEIRTSYIKIHYSNDGIHAVPCYKRG